MKRNISWILLFCAVWCLTGISVRAQEKPEEETLVIKPGNDFHAALEKEGVSKRSDSP